MRITALLICLLLAACSWDDPPSTVVTKDVDLAVGVACHPKAPDGSPVISKRPKDLMTAPDLKAKLDATALTDEKAIIISRQLVLHMQWLPIIEGAEASCEKAPSK